MGRPKKIINETQVETLAQLHCTYEEIAAVVGCSTDTLKRRFADCIERGREHGKASLRRAQFRAALGGNATMLIWLGKQHLEQRDRHDVRNEVTGKDGAPLIPGGRSLEDMSDAELTALAAQLAPTPTVH